jgi:colanic acid biosynthesis glycosyl transferase WcaI
MIPALFLTQCFPPETFAGANRAHALAAALAERHDLTVLTLRPGYPTPDCVPADATEGFDSRARFRISRSLRLSPHGQRSAMRRAGMEQVMAVSLALRGLPRRAELVVTSSPSMFLGPAALVLARLKRARFVWDLRDITWELAAEVVGRTRIERLAVTCLRSVMWGTARRCDLLVAATGGIERLAREAGVDPGRIVTVENGISGELLARMRSKRAMVPKARPVVTYIGLIGIAQQLTVLADVAHQMPGVDFLIAGEGPQRRDLEARARDAGVSNLHYLGYQAPDELPKLCQRSDVMFAQVVDSPLLTDTALPTKLLEYMAAGRPVVYAGRGAAAALVAEARAGVCVRPGDAGAIVQAIGDLLSDPVRRTELGRNAAAFVDGLRSREERMQGLVSRFRALCPLDA